MLETEVGVTPSGRPNSTITQGRQSEQQPPQHWWRTHSFTLFKNALLKIREVKLTVFSSFLKKFVKALSVNSETGRQWKIPSKCWYFPLPSLFEIMLQQFDEFFFNKVFLNKIKECYYQFVGPAGSGFYQAVSSVLSLPAGPPHQQYHITRQNTFWHFVKIKL